MSGKVWVSLMMVDSTLRAPLSADIVLNDEAKAIQNSQRHAKGEWLPAEAFPKEIYANHSERKLKKRPEVFYGNGFWCVSAACAEVLLRFDLGGGGLYPVKLLQHDRVTPIEGEYFCLNFGARKTAVLPQHSRNFRKPWEHSDILWLQGFAEDFDVAVSSSALEGPDLWTDPTLDKAVFFSDRLAGALKAANLSRRFKLGQCRIIEAQSSAV